MSTAAQLCLRATLGGHHVDLTRDFGADGSALTGSLDLDVELGTYLAALARELGVDELTTLLDFVAGVGVRVTRVEARSDPATGVWSASVRCDVGEQGHARLGFGTTAGAFAAAMRLDATITLEGTPLFGGLLGGISIVDFLVVYATADLKGPIDLAGTTIAGAVSRGLSLAFTLAAGDVRQPIALSFPAGARLADSEPATAGTVKWVAVQKSLGPLSIQRVGVRWRDGRLSLMLDASVAVAALTLALKEFAVGVTPKVFADPTHPDVQVDLGGIGLTCAPGPTRITGAFLRRAYGDVVEYAGQGAIESPGFLLSAMGSYANDAKGEPSVFVFAMLNRPLGGPAFCFVTGVAAGFGYNRALRIPPLDQLPRFPLIAAAMSDAAHPNPFRHGNDPGAALEVLHEFVPPKSGEYWIAAGLRFTSFEMLQSFVLASIAFGGDVQIAVLGLSALTVPTGATDPIAYAELALAATYKPETGVLAVAGKLTPSSFILDRKCQLTGGFAFSTWFTGRDAGDFVVTLGGYHPHFEVPAHYPSAPRLGVSWPVSGNLSVKGEFYFALTPSAVMGGGSMNAVWQSGDLRAWFTAEADFLLSWKPFHYAAHLEIGIGASYRLDLLFTSTTVTVHVGVALDLWGPSFAGTARVDLYVVSFTIAFGPRRTPPAPISWTDFRQSFLPNSRDGVHCDVRVTGGLVRDLSDVKRASDDLDWILDSETLALTTASACPSRQARLVTMNGGVTKELTGSWRQTPFGAGPVGIADGKLLSAHVITINRVVRDAGVWKTDSTYDFARWTTADAVTGGIPSAVWRRDTALQPSIDRVNTGERLVPNAMTGAVVKAIVLDPGHTQPVDLAVLQATAQTRRPKFHWTAPSVPTTDPYRDRSPIGELTTTIDSGATGARAAILRALRSQQLAVPAAANVSAMRAHAGDVLLDGPMLNDLGEDAA